MDWTKFSGSWVRLAPFRCDSLSAIVFLVVFVVSIDATQAQTTAERLSSLPKETIQLTDGQTLSGMVLHKTDDVVEFLELRHPPGKPSFAVIHTFQSSRVAETTSIDEGARKQLSKYVDRMRNRTQVRAAERQSLTLTRGIQTAYSDEKAWLYDSEDFRLISYVNEDLTRTLAVRADQILQAFRHWLPPRTQPEKRIEVVLFGANYQYSLYLQQRGLQISNPAIFLPESNCLLIGTDLGTFSDRLAVLDEHYQSVRNQLQSEERKLQDHLNQLSRSLKDAAWPEDRIAVELQARKEAWNTRKTVSIEAMRRDDRQNKAQIDALLDQATRHLGHEFFHAYLQNFLYPYTEYHVPIWLNEGLAQLFEHAQFENGTFRIDHPPAVLLERLQDRLRTDGGECLRKMLLDQPQSSWVYQEMHERPLSYEVAWGLAWYLVFQKDLFSDPGISKYVTPASINSTTSPLTKPGSLSTLQHEWAQYILAL